MLEILPDGKLVMEKETMQSIAKELFLIISNHYDSVENQEREEEADQ